VLCLEAFAVLLVPRAIAQTSTGLGGLKTGLLLGFAAVLVATATVLRRRWGIGFGSLVQVPFLLIGIWCPPSSSSACCSSACGCTCSTCATSWSAHRAASECSSPDTVDTLPM